MDGISILVEIDVYAVNHTRRNTFWLLFSHFINSVCVMVDVIIGCCFTELMKHKIRIPSEMVQNLMLLHSYILVKVRLNR